MTQARAMSAKREEFITKKVVAKLDATKKSNKLREKKGSIWFVIRGSGVLLEDLSLSYINYQYTVNLISLFPPLLVLFRCRFQISTSKVFLVYIIKQILC